MDYYYEFKADKKMYLMIHNKLFNMFGSPVLLSFGIQGDETLIITESEREAEVCSEYTGQPIVKKQYEVTDNRQNQERSFTWGT